MTTRNALLSLLRDTVARLRSRDPRSVLTSELIQMCTGEFRSNVGIPASLSPNALFGRLVSRHRELLGLCLLRRRVSVVDVAGHRTRSAEWAIR